MGKKKYPERIFVDPERMENGHPSGELDFDDGEGSVEYIHIDRHLDDIEALENRLCSAECKLTETAAERDRLKLNEEAYKRLCGVAASIFRRVAAHPDAQSPGSEITVTAFQVAVEGDPLDALRSIEWLASQAEEPGGPMATSALELMEERDRLRAALEAIRGGQHTYAGIRDIADVALAKAPPHRPDAGQVNAELLEGLKRVERFVADELENRLASPNWEDEEGPYISDAKNALTAIRALITKAEGAQS
jgi:hypothetical protein